MTNHDPSLHSCSLVLEFNPERHGVMLLACTELDCQVSRNITHQRAPAERSLPELRSQSVEPAWTQQDDPDDPVWQAKQRLKERARSQLRMAEKNREKEVLAAKSAHQRRVEARERHRVVIRKKVNAVTTVKAAASGFKQKMTKQQPDWARKSYEHDGVDSWESSGKLPVLHKFGTKQLSSEVKRNAHRALKDAGHNFESGLRGSMKENRNSKPSPYALKKKKRKENGLPYIKTKRDIAIRSEEDMEEAVGSSDDQELQKLLQEREKMRTQYVQAEMEQKKRELEQKQKTEMSNVTSKLQAEINDWKEKIAKLEDGSGSLSQSEVAGQLLASESSPHQSSSPHSHQGRNVSPGASSVHSRHSVHSTHSSAHSRHSSHASFQPADVLAEVRRNAGASNPPQSLESLVKRLSEPIDVTGNTAPGTTLPSQSIAPTAPMKMAPQPATQVCDEEDCDRVCHPGSSKCYRHKVLAEPAFGDLDPNKVPRWRQNTDDPFGLLKSIQNKKKLEMVD